MTVRDNYAMNADVSPAAVVAHVTCYEWRHTL